MKPTKLSSYISENLVSILEARLANDLSPSVFVNTTNPKNFSDLHFAKALHQEFIKLTKESRKGLDKEVDFINEPYVYRELVGEHELIIEKLYNVDDNILQISLGPAQLHSELMLDVLTDVSFLKSKMIEHLNATNVSIKVTY